MSPTSLPEEQIFQAARRIESNDARRDYLDHACGTDTQLRERVEALLVALESSESFLESPASEAAAERPTAHLSVSERPGDTIGPYKLLQEIGEGGMGVVYMADQSEPLERRVALEDHQAGHGHPAGDRPFRGGAASPGDDGPSEHRQGARCGDHRHRSAVLRDGTGERCSHYRVLRSASANARTSGWSCSYRSAKRCSTPIRKGSSIATSSRRMCWWPTTTTDRFPKSSTLAWPRRSSSG